MPAIAHIGAGFAAKKLIPDVSVIYLIIAAEFVEIVFFVFVLAGIESMPQPEKSPFSPYSHGVFMGVVWSAFAVLITYLICKNWKVRIIIGLLVLSHTILDIIASPKLAFYPTDTKMPVFFNDSLSVGLGLFKYKSIALISEFGFLIIGLLIYILTIIKNRSQIIVTNH